MSVISCGLGVVVLFQTANQLRGAAKVSLYGAKILFACSRTSSAVMLVASTRPPDS